MDRMRAACLILALTAIIASAVGCATPRGTVKLDGGDKAEQVDHVFPGTNFVLWTTFTLKEGAFASTIKLLRSCGRWLVICGIGAVVACAIVFFATQSAIVHGLCTTGLVGGGIAFVTGIVVSLMANVWVLAAILIAVACGGAALGYWLWKTRRYSVVGAWRSRGAAKSPVASDSANVAAKPGETRVSS